MGLCIVGAKDIANYKKRYGARLIDLRSSEEYRRGHIEGAVHVPVDRLRQYMQSVPSNQMLIFYCQHGSQSFQEGKGMCGKDTGFVRWQVDIRPIDR